MRSNKINLNEQKSSLSQFVQFLAVAIALVLAPVSAQATGGKVILPNDNSVSGSGKHQKFSADLAGYPLNSDGTVSVIIQFNQTPTAQHFADMAARGGKLKFSL